MSAEQTDAGVAKLKDAFKEEMAPYKIELHFGKDRTSQDTYGAMVCWESGKELHGGGDQQMFLCSYGDCNRYFPGDYVAGHLAICPYCKREMYRDRNVRVRAMKEEGMPDRPVMSTMYHFSGPVKDLSELVAGVWSRLLMNESGEDAGADIYLVYHPSDIRVRQIVMAEQLDLARARRVPVIYLFSRIVKDTSSGMSLVKAIHAFLTA